MVSKFAAAIKAGLYVKGVSQSVLAEKVGVSENTVSRWVTDICLPDRESKTALTKFFDWEDATVLRLAEDWFENEDNHAAYRIAGAAFVKERYADDYKLFLRDLIAIDYDTVEGLDASTEGNEEQWAPVFKEFPLITWRLLTYKNEIVGYWHCPFLKEYYFNLVRNGSILDSELNPEMLEHALLPRNYCAHFTIFTILPIHHNTKAFDCLRKSISKMVEELADSERYFSVISAHAFTLMGKRLCETLGMKKDGSFFAPSGSEIQRYILKGKEMKSSVIVHKSRVGRKYKEKFG